jgi:hypothetical protein
MIISPTGATEQVNHGNETKYTGSEEIVNRIHQIMSKFKPWYPIDEHVAQDLTI